MYTEISRALSVRSAYSKILEVVSIVSLVLMIPAFCFMDSSDLVKLNEKGSQISSMYIY